MRVIDVVGDYHGRPRLADFVSDCRVEGNQPNIAAVNGSLARHRVYSSEEDSHVSRSTTSHSLFSSRERSRRLRIAAFNLRGSTASSSTGSTRKTGSPSNSNNVPSGSTGRERTNFFIALDSRSRLTCFIMDRAGIEPAT